MEKNFSIKQAFSYGFSTLFEHAGLIFSAFLTSVVVALGVISAAAALLFWGFKTAGLPNALEKLVTSDPLETLGNPKLVLALCIVLVVIFVVWVFLYSLSLGFSRILLDIYESKSSSLSRLFSCVSIAKQAFLATFLLHVMLSIGFALLLLPGFFIAALYGFSRLGIIDRRLGVFESFSYSYRLARGAVWKLFCFYIVMAALLFPFVLTTYLVHIFSILLWIIIVPALRLSKVFVYKKLQEQTI
jgi:uncharacterized membrane protein